MADSTIDNLTAAVGTDLDDADLFLVLDGTNPPKKITRAELVKGLHGTGVAGDILYHNGTTWVRLAKGTAGKILEMNSGATAPAWASGGLQFISSTDLSNDATCDFTGWGSLNYDFYKIVLQNVVPATDAAQLILRTTANDVTFDSGASNYQWSGSHAWTTGVRNGAGSSTATEMNLVDTIGVGSAANEDGVSGEIIIYNPSLAKKTFATWHVGLIQSADGSHANVQGSGHRVSSAAATGVRLLFSSGNLESGTITLYGGRNS